MNPKLELGQTWPDAILARAAEPEVGDKFTRGDLTAKVVKIDGLLVDVEVSNGEGKCTNTFNLQRWRHHVRATLNRDSEFYPNSRSSDASEASCL